MIPKKLLILASTFLIMLLASTAVSAQQSKPVLPNNPAQKEMPGYADAGNYSYKLYSTPNNMYGYDIYKDGKPVYHQFVVLFVSKEGKRLIATKPQAEKAALLALKKINQGESPLLSGEELKAIIALK